PNAAPQAQRNLDQQCVGDVVSERVVDHLEAIDVDEEDCHVFADAFRGQQAHLQAFDKQTSIGQLRQRVVIGQELDLFLGPLPIADVDGRHMHDGTLATAKKRDVRKY